MMRSAQMAIEAVERLRKAQRELDQILREIVQPIDPNDLLNPFDCAEENEN